MEEINESWKRLRFLANYEGLDSDSKTLLLHRFRQIFYWGSAVGLISVIFSISLKSRGYFRTRFSEDFHETKTAIAILLGSLTPTLLTGSFFLYLMHSDSTKIYNHYLESGKITQEEVINSEIEIERLRKEREAP